MRYGEELSGRIISCVIRVHQTLGPGYSEPIYKRAMLIELRKQNLNFECEKEVTIFYDGVEIGRYRIDLVVEGKLIVELKVAEALGKAQYAQLRSYLAATGLNIGLLVNFAGERADYRRVISPASPAHRHISQIL